MSLLAPAWLLLCALSALVLLLHARRRKTVEIPSIQIWRQLEGGRHTRRPIRRPPFNLALLLQLLVVAFCALALAQPLIGSGPRFDHEIFVLDASGSMRSTDVVPSRFDMAVTDLAKFAQGPVKQTRARISVILGRTRPLLVAARLSYPEGLAPQLAQLRAGDGNTDWDEVARLAASLRRDGEATRIILLTDGVDGAAARLFEALPGIKGGTRIYGSSGGQGSGVHNASLRAELRAVDAAAGKWRALGSVTFSPGQSGATTVTAWVQPEGSDGFLEWAGTEVRRDPMRVATPGAAAAADFTLDLDLRGGAAIMLRLPDDSGPHDNAVQFIVRSKPRPLKVLQIGAINTAFARALAAAGDVELYAGDNLPSDTAAFDLVVVDRSWIDRSPPTNVVWLGRGGPAESPIPLPSGVNWLVDHPLTESIFATSIKPGRADRLPPLEGSTVLLESGGAPLIEARTTPAGREVRIAFDIESSDWPESPSFPLFVSNLLNWIAPDRGATIDRPCHAGTNCALDPRLAGARIETLVTPVGKGQNRHDPALPLAGPAASLAAGSATTILPYRVDPEFVPDRAGLYRFTRDGLTRYLAVNAAPSSPAAAPVAAAIAAPPLSDWSNVRPPWWWLVAAVLSLMLVEAYLAGRGTERFLHLNALMRGNPLALRRRLLLAVNVVAIMFALAAILDVPLLVPDRTENVVVVAGPHLRVPGIDVVAQISTAAERNPEAATTRLGLVGVDATSRLLADLGHDVRSASGSNESAPTAANVEDALMTAAAMLPADAPGRIVIATNGNETRGNFGLMLPTLKARGLKVDVLPMPQMPAGEVLVERVSVPARIYAGDPVALKATILSRGGMSATLRILKDDNVIVERALDLADGRNTIEADLPPATFGRVRYEVAVDAQGDTIRQNNRDGVTIDVLAAPDVLIVTPQAAWAEVLVKSLALHEIKTKVVEPKRAPYYLKDWLSYSAIVLMNVPAIDLATLQQELIEKAVADHGRGLIVLGGENSFGPGGYYETPLERVSPLSSRVPRDAPKVAMAFVLDRSGSMQRDEGGATRLDIAKQATLAAIRLLHEESLISIIAFDSEARVLMPLGRAKDSSAVTQALAGLDPGGGTAIYPGLVEALKQFEGVDAMAKHIVVMSDGLSQPGDFPGILKAITERNISVSSVAIGEGANPAQLETIARAGKGAFHATQDFKALPSILSQEALLLSGKPIEERSAMPMWVTRNAEFFAGLPEVLPPIQGYVLTTRKAEADLHLSVADATDEQEPLFASWRYGNGRVAALGTQGAGAWSLNCQAMPQHPLMWSQIVCPVFTSNQRLKPRMVRHGDEVGVTIEALNQDGVPRGGLKISAALIGPDLKSTDIALVETSTGHYAGRAMLNLAGDFTLRVGAEGTTAEAPLHVAYPAF